MANDRRPGAPDGTIEVLDDAHLEEADVASDVTGGFEDEATAIYRSDAHAVPGMDYEDEATRVYDPADEGDEFEDEATRVWQHDGPPVPRAPAPRLAGSGMPRAVQLPQQGVSAVASPRDRGPMPDEATVITDSASLYPGAAAPRQQVARPQVVGPAAAPAASKKGSPAVVVLIGVLVAALVAIVFFLVRGTGPAEPAVGTMALFTSPAGAAVTLDGQRLPNTTPTTLSDLTVGVAHTLVLELEGFEPIEETLVVSAEGLQQREFEFAPSAGSVVVRTAPAGAAITVDGISRGISPVSVPGLDTARAHDIVATLDGHEPARRTVSFPSGGPREQLVALTLSPVVVPTGEGSGIAEPAEVAAAPESDRTSGSSSTRSTSSSSSRTSSRTSDTAERPSTRPSERTSTRPSTRTTTTSAPRERPSSTRPSTETATAEPTGVGTISVQAVPFGQVWIDGRMVAPETPLISHQLQAGVHRVKVYYVNLRQFSDERSVRIEPDGNRTVTFRAAQ